MKQHAVPQEIMAVEFNLFGAMNVRQFGYVAGGGAVGYFLFLIMPGLLKWPFAVVSVLFGLGLAFLPIDDRPMDLWVSNFLLSLKRPTRRVWKKTPEAPAFLVEQVEVIEKKYKKAKPTVIAKRRGPEEARVFSARGEDEEILRQEVAKVDKEIEQMVVESGVEAPVVEDAAAPRMVMRPEISQVASDLIETLEQEPAPGAAVTQSALTSDPNLVNGKILDNEGNPVIDALVLVRDYQNRPVQVLKTDNEGAFLSTTPIAAGEYSLVAEKMGLRYKPVKIVVTGKVIPFVSLQAI